MASLFVIRGNDQGMRFDLEESMMRLGRDSSNAIQLHDTEVSRRHVELYRSGETICVRDLGSSNGTYVNGEPVDERPLNNGDQLQVGRTLLLFTEPGKQPHGDLSDQVDIITRRQPADRSRIVRTISQEESSRIFDIEADSSQSPWLARARSNLQVMYRTALAVSHTLEIDELLERILGLIFEWVEADRGCIMLVDPETTELEPKARRDRQGKPPGEKLLISRSILDYVMQHGEGVLTSDAREDDRWNATGSIVQAGIREAICVPMQGRYDVVGLIYVDTSTSPDAMIRRGGRDRFSDEHLKLMVAIAHQAALAVEDTRYYSAMVQAERLAAVGQTIATLSHHIKNILQGIRGGSYLIEMGLSDHDESVVAKGWTMVEKNQAKISNLVLDMLTFSKERDPEMVAGDLNQVVGDVCELMAARAAELEVELDWQPGEGLPTLRFDPEGMHRAVLNLVTNAIDACDNDPDEDSSKASRVRVRSQYLPDERQVRLSVEDTGCGIPPEEVQKIFTLFVSHKGSRGTGLGLPVSNKIVREHGGKILVETAPGEGSCFTIELPAVLPESTSDGDDHEEPSRD